MQNDSNNYKQRDQAIRVLGYFTGRNAISSKEESQPERAREGNQGSSHIVDTEFPSTSFPDASLPQSRQRKGREVEEHRLEQGSRTELHQLVKQLRTELLSTRIQLAGKLELEQQLRTELRSTKTQLSGELRNKDAELAEMKKMLRLYDDCSEADLRRTVDKINEKIRDLTLDVANKWVEDASKVPEEGGHTKLVTDGAEVEFVKSIIGLQLFNALTNVQPGQSACAPFLLQFAWQACIVAVTTKILRSFSATHAAFPKEYIVDEVLREISNGVMEREIQPVFGHWRFTTHQNLRRITSSEEQAIQTYVGEALGSCLIAGRLLLKNRCPDDEALANAFEVKLKEITADAFKLLTNIQEKIVTTNYEPYTLSYREPFQDACMALDEQDHPYPDDFVVCTTGIGLQYSRKQGRENTHQTPPKYVFRKAEVLTEKNLLDIIAL